jgi:methyl-galactoside transport system substrate-binding protein
MRKGMAVLLALVMIISMLSFVGCDKGGGDFVVDVFFYDYTDTYISTVRASMKTQLDALTGVQYTFYDAASDQATQTEQVDTALTRGTDLLIVNIVTTGSVDAAQNIVDAAKEKDVAVIFFNREIADSVVESYDNCCFVGTDPDEAGYMQGQMMAEYLLKDDNLGTYDLNNDKKIAYIMLRGELGNAEAFGRTLYSVQKANELLADSGYTLVPSVANATDNTQPDDGVSPYFLYGNWSQANAKALMDTALSTYSLTDGSIELIIANNDDQALGAIESLKELGYNKGTAGKFIPVFGVDATSTAQTAIGEGSMVGSIKQDNVAMATGILFFMNNVKAGKNVMAVTTGYNIDEGVAKIRIPYAIYIG